MFKQFSSHPISPLKPEVGLETFQTLGQMASHLGCPLLTGSGPIMTVSVQGSACLLCSCSLPPPCLGPLRAARLTPLGHQLPNRVGFPCSGWQMLGPGISQEYSDSRILPGSSNHCNSQSWLTWAHQCSLIWISLRMQLPCGNPWDFGGFTRWFCQLRYGG